jgi:hypothetical protein
MACGANVHAGWWGLAGTTNSSLARKALSGIGAQRISLRKSQHRDRISGNRALRDISFDQVHWDELAPSDWNVRSGFKQSAPHAGARKFTQVECNTDHADRFTVVHS